MSTSRRELLTMGGAGVAALAFPSFLPGSVGGGGIALAQGNGKPDPILGEIITQFQRMRAGLLATPARGNAREGAATYRMLAAWARANNFDRTFKQLVTDAVDREGHHNLVSRLTSTDWVAEAKKHGVPLPLNFQAPNYTTFAKGIAYIRGGFSLEKEWRRRSWLIARNAARIDRMLAIRNGAQDDMAIRRVWQEGDVDGDGLPDSIDGYDDRPPVQNADCVFNSDGSITCQIGGSSQPPPNTGANGEPEGCDEAELFMILSSVALAIFGAYYSLGWLFYFGLFDQAYFSIVLYMANCL